MFAHITSAVIIIFLGILLGFDVTNEHNVVQKQYMKWDFFCFKQKSEKCGMLFLNAIFALIKLNKTERD